MGKRSDVLGIAPTASDGTQSGEDLRARPLLRRGEALESVLECLNVLNRKDRDIEYLYDSQLRTEAAPVTDIHVHPAEPRMFRARLTYRW